MPSNVTAAERAVALYYRGLAIRHQEARDPDQSTDQWKLTLLQIPAEFQDPFPELSAAAIYEVLQGSDRGCSEYASLAEELTDRFSQTWHGRQYLSSGK
jgi:hypothetical protein